MHRLVALFTICFCSLCCAAAHAAPGEVLASQRISEDVGGLDGEFGDLQTIGGSLAVIGDLDDDGIEDVAAGFGWLVGPSPPLGPQNGVRILFMNANGTVKAHTALTSGTPVLSDVYDPSIQFGASIAALGDIDGDFVPDIVVGAPSATNDASRGAPTPRGSLFVVRLNSDGSVKGVSEIKEGVGGFTGSLGTDDRFGASVAVLGDVDGDLIPDLAVGAPNDDDGRSGNVVNAGAVWLLFMNSDGTVKSHQKLSEANGGLSNHLAEPLEAFDGFGFSVAGPGDVDGDLIPDLVVGVPGDDGGVPADPESGAVYCLFLNDDGTVKGGQLIRDSFGGFESEQDSFDLLGYSMVAVPSFDPDGVPVVAVGATRDDDLPPLGGGGFDRGAVYMFYFNADGTISKAPKISAAAGRLDADLNSSAEFGTSIAAFSGLNDDSVPDLIVGAPGILDSDSEVSGALFTLLMRGDGWSLSEKFITESTNGFTGELSPGDLFGSSVAGIGDVNGDGINDLAVGARGDSTNGELRGAVWVLFLDSEDTVIGHQKINDTDGNLPFDLNNGDNFGVSVSTIGDWDGDGVPDIAVGASGDDGMTTDTRTGAVYLLSLQSDGTVKNGVRISGDRFNPPVQTDHSIGQSLAYLPGLDNTGTGLTHLAIGAPGLNTGSGVEGGVMLIGFDSEGEIIQLRQLTFGGPVAFTPGTLYGQALAYGGPSDLFSGEGQVLYVGAPTDFAFRPTGGAAYAVTISPGFLSLFSEKLDPDDFTDPAPSASTLWFGWSMAALGDMDGDGGEDLLVGTLPELEDGIGLVSFLNEQFPKSFQPIYPPASATPRGFTQDGPEQFGFAYAGLATRSHAKGALVAVGAPRWDLDSSQRDAGRVWLMRLHAIGGDLPAAATARPVLHVEAPPGSAAAWLYVWESSGDDQGISHGPKPENEDEVHEGELGATFDEGETWKVTVTPYNEFGEPGESFEGEFAVGPDGSLTFEGWTIL